MLQTPININKAVKFTRNEVALVLEAFAHHVAEDAKLNHTFVNRSGELEGSIRVEKTGTSRQGFVEYRVVAGNAVVYYAVYVELGTVKMSAKPFLRPALERQKARFL